MPEQQAIEYKQNWHDDCLKWVCGFANARDGVIFIGKNDNGRQHLTTLMITDMTFFEY